MLLYLNNFQVEELEWSGANNKKEIADKLVQSGLHLNELDKCLYVARRDKETYQGMLQTSEVIFGYLFRFLILFELTMLTDFEHYFIKNKFSRS